MTQLKLENNASSEFKNNLFIKIIFFLYGIFCYVLFLATFIYAIGFASNFLVTKSMDTGGTTSFLTSLVIDTSF